MLTYKTADKLQLIAALKEANTIAPEGATKSELWSMYKNLEQREEFLTELPMADKMPAISAIEEIGIEDDIPDSQLPSELLAAKNIESTGSKPSAEKLHTNQTDSCSRVVNASSTPNSVWKFAVQVLKANYSYPIIKTLEEDYDKAMETVYDALPRKNMKAMLSIPLRYAGHLMYKNWIHGLVYMSATIVNSMYFDKQTNQQENLALLVSYLEEAEVHSKASMVSAKDTYWYKQFQKWKN